MMEALDIGGFGLRADQCKEQERARKELIDDLVSALRSTTDELARAKLDLENEVSVRRDLQQRNKDLSSKVTGRPYVTVIIDADGYQFLGTGEGAKGGQQAADTLIVRIREYLKSLGAEFERCEIVVEAYANTEGLGQALVIQGRVRSAEELRLFWTGFVCRQRLFSYVDVGRGKENADQKIRERVEFHTGLRQCKQVLLACCHDEGYAPFLGPYASTGRLSLLQNEVCRPKIKALCLPIVKFPGLFVEPLASDVVMRPTSRQKHQNPFALQARLGPILANEHSGLRYDRLITVKADTLQKMEKTGLCFYFYLTGRCKGCERVHKPGYKLTVEEFDAVWHIARRGQCYKSQKRKPCTDELCIYGHKA